MDKLNQLVGDKIEAARKARKMTQEELGKLIGLSRVSIVNIEAGRVSLTLPNLYKMSFALEVHPRHFLVDPDLLTDGIEDMVKQLEKMNIEPSRARAFIFSELY
jgi:transcriptional regulator with XRE-family HTH domain